MGPICTYTLARRPRIKVIPAGIGHYAAFAQLRRPHRPQPNCVVLGSYGYLALRRVENASGGSPYGVALLAH